MTITPIMIQDWLKGRGYENTGIMASAEFLKKYKDRLEYGAYVEFERIVDEIREADND